MNAAPTLRGAGPAIGACVFDAYGTLLDLNGAIEPAVSVLGAQAPALLALWRSKQLEYTWLRSLMARYADFAQVTADALSYACDVMGEDAVRLRPLLLDAFTRLSPYPDARHLLQGLRSDGVKTAVLSNGTPAMLKDGLGAAGLLGELDAVLSVDSVGTYKPSPAVYRLPSQVFALPVASTVFVSGNAWDAAGAASAGLPVIWVNRSGAPRERLPDGPSVEVRSLADVAAALPLFGGN